MISREHDLLDGLVRGPGWDLYKLRISEQVRVLYQQILDPSLSRQSVRPDDFIRGMIFAYRDAIEWPRLELEAAAQAEAEALSNQEEGVIPLFGHGRPESDEGARNDGTTD